jgi:hypothetical protein
LQTKNKRIAKLEEVDKNNYIESKRLKQRITDLNMEIKGGDDEKQRI